MTTLELKEQMIFRNPNQAIPPSLVTDRFVLRRITADDAETDYAALMDTRESLRLWQQSTWPDDDFTLEANRADLAGLEQRHDQRLAYTYTVIDPEGIRCLGCVYLFPFDATFLAKSEVKALTSNRWRDVQAVAYFWVRRDQLETGGDEHLLESLREWFAGDWKLTNTVYAVSDQFTQQIELFDRTDLNVLFEVHEPGKAGAFRIYGTDRQS